MREGHFKWWDTHKVADSAYPEEKLVPGFKCAPYLLCRMSCIHECPSLSDEHAMPLCQPVHPSATCSGSLVAHAAEASAEWVPYSTRGWRGCRQTTKDFMGAMPNVYERILSCFALGLGYPEEFFKEVCARRSRPLLCCCLDIIQVAVTGKPARPWAVSRMPVLSHCCAAHVATMTDTCVAHGVQASDVRDPDNYSVFVVNYYPKTEGITWKPDTNRITPHTDETLVTLLFTSPGALSSGLPARAGFRRCSPIQTCISLSNGFVVAAGADSRCS